MSNEEKAKILNDKGKVYHNLTQHDKALQFYSDAIHLCPTEYMYWGNRSACYLAIHKYKEALNDAKTSVELNNKYIRGYIRISKCYKNLDDLKQAEKYLKSNNDNLLNDSVLNELEEIKNLLEYESNIIQCFKNKDYNEALTYIEKYLKKIPVSRKYILYRAECLHHLQDITEFDKIMKEFPQYFLNDIEDEIIKNFKCLNFYKQRLLSDPNRIEAERKNEQGNTYFNLKDYVTAKHFYTTAIEKFPSDARYWGNRSACHIMLEEYTSAMADAYKSIEINEKYAKGHLRMAKCKKYFNDLISAKNALHTALLLTPDDSTVKNELKEIETLIQFETKIKYHYENNDYNKSIKYIDRYLTLQQNNQEYKFKKAKCYVKLNNYTEAQNVLSELAKLKPDDENISYLEAELHYYKDDIRESIDHLKKIRKKIPDHYEMNALYKKSKSILDYINQSLNTTEPIEKYNLLTKAIQIDKNNRITNRNLYKQKFKYAFDYSIFSEEVLNECHTFIHTYGKNLAILKTRAKCYMHIKDYEGARDDYEIIIKREPTSTNLLLFSEAEKLFQREIRDEYSILGLESNATNAQIKRAYIELMKKYHTDKQNDVTPEIKERLNKKFVRIKKTYEELMKKL